MQIWSLCEGFSSLKARKKKGLGLWCRRRFEKPYKIMNKKSYEVFSHEMNNLFCLKCFLTSCAKFNWIEYFNSHDLDWNWSETNKILSTRLFNETEKQNKLDLYLTLVSLNNHKTFKQCIIKGPANSPYKAGKFLVHIEAPIKLPI